MAGRAPTIAAFLFAVGCGGPTRAPPPPLLFNDLPVSGSLATALDTGFNRCLEFIIDMRCLKHGVMIEGQGPYNAAVDLVGSDGSGGFDVLTLWHDDDQTALFAVGRALEQRGWQTCITGQGYIGDQKIYTRAGSPVRMSMDISYYMKRRLRIFPEWNAKKPRCQPESE